MSKFAILIRNDVVIVAVGQILQQIITMGSGIIVAHALGSYGYGIVNLLRAIFAGLITVAPLGLDVALLKYGGRNDVDSEHVRSVIRLLRIISACFNSLLALVIGVGFGDLLMRDVYRFDQFNVMLAVTLLALPFAADLGVMGAVYKVRGRPGLYALMTIYLQPVLRLSLTAVVISISPTVMAVVAINSVQVVCSSLMVILHYHQMTGIWGRTRRKIGSDFSSAWNEAIKVLGESSWMALNLLVYGMMRFIDVLVLGYYVSAQEVGEYAALSAISQLVQIYPLSLSQTLGPNISRQYHAGDLNGVRRTLDAYIYLAGLVSGFIFGGIAVFGPRLDLIFGASFHFKPAVSILMPLGYLFSATLAPTGFALSMTGRHRAELVVLCSGGVILISLCAILIPIFGQIGASAAVASAFLLVNIIRFGYVAKVLRFIPGSWRDLLPPAVGLILALLAREIVDLGFERKLIGLIVACGVYALFYGLASQMFLFQPSTRAWVHKQLLYLLRS